MRDEKPPLCSGCGAESRLPGQRYGRECRNEANRKYRARLRLLMGRLHRPVPGGDAGNSSVQRGHRG